MDYRLIHESGEGMNSYFDILDKQGLKSSKKYLYVKYLTVGKTIIKIENYVPELTTHVETQWAFCLRDKVDSYDCTLHIRKDDIYSLLKDDYKKVNGLTILPIEYAETFISISPPDNLFAYNAERKVTYYLANEFSLERIRKMGHIFAHTLAKMSKTPEQVLIHSAAVGINGKGVLLSAKGGKGKTTLAISALLNGFQYVSDDYTILNKSDDGFFAYPIYSTINLTPEMQEKMAGLRVCYMWDSWWNPRKQTLDLSAHHDSFVEKLPVKAIVFPQICNVEKPSIELMQDKDKAIVQMAYSTIQQLISERHQRAGYMSTILSLTKKLDFYQINLSPDLQQNVECLRQFIESL